MTSLGQGKVIALSAAPRAATVREPDPGPSLGYAAPRGMVDAAQRARRILADAESAAAARLADASRHVAEMRDEIREQVAAEFAIEHARKLVELTTLRQRVIERAREEIVHLASVLAQRIIGEELSLDPGKQVALACQVLRDVGGAERVTIHAEPNAAEVLRREVCRLEATTPARIEIVPASDLTPGDLRIETDIGSIDACLRTQLSHLVFAIVETLRS